MKENRVKTVEVLHKIPRTVKKAADRMQDHPDDDILFDAVTRLYLTVLKTIEGMLRWLIDTSTCQFGSWFIIQCCY